MLTVITGATGHVGNVLVRELRARGRRVRALVPDFEDRSCLDGLGVEICTADVREPDSLVRGLAGADVVFHLAGLVSITGDRAGQLRVVNVTGTRNVVRACRQVGVGRLVYTSSVHALPEPPCGVPLRETARFDPARVLGDYARSKAEASREVLAGVEEGLDAVMVFPSGIIGPYDYRPS
ncbi:MAG: NAD-dependent epimerase/dehydratase family protein, partial [candidate division WOR-3 bacterium]